MFKYDHIMKSILMRLITLLSVNLNAQKMNTPQDIVTSLFIATDQQKWEKVAQLFHEEVLLDYSSMNGNPAATLSSQEIITAWKTILPGFEHTHHQLGNFLSKIDQQKATVFCYGTASHYLTNENGNVWTVVGSYDFELVKQHEGSWKISSMKFNFSYQNGNTALPKQAMQNAK